MDEEKRCSTCKEVKSKTEFSKRRASRDGLSYSCKPCQRKQAMDSYKKGKALGKRKQYYQDNREAILARNRDYYEANKDRLLEQNRQYRQDNPEVWRQADARRRKRMRGGETFERWEIIKRDSVDGVPICQICKQAITDRNKIHVDHIIPLAQGGENTRDNVRVTCKSCNIRRPKDGRDV